MSGVAEREGARLRRQKGEFSVSQYSKAIVLLRTEVEIHTERGFCQKDSHQGISWNWKSWIIDWERASARAFPGHSYLRYLAPLPPRLEGSLGLSGPCGSLGHGVAFGCPPGSVSLAKGHAHQVQLSWVQMAWAGPPVGQAAAHKPCQRNQSVPAEIQGL